MAELEGEGAGIVVRISDADPRLRVVDSAGFDGPIRILLTIDE